ncbi:MAG: phytoene desaturase family protein [Nocardioidaceae bacterium]
MADIIVVGAGLGGMAAAARLAKLGHHVTVCERNTAAGGAIRKVKQDGFRWDAGPTSTTLPAVLRDLFRKSGRPLERYLDLRMRTPARRHVFEDGSAVDLPTGSRADQRNAIDSELGAGSGRAWTDLVDVQSHVWDALRRQVLDVPDGGQRLGDREVARALSARTPLARLVKRSLKDERLRLMAGYPFRLYGSELRDVPAYAAVELYVERNFGVWSPAGGMAGLTDALVTRLAERGVELRLEAEVVSIPTADDRVTGVRTLAGNEIHGDVVVTDIDPRAVFRDLVHHRATAEAARYFDQATPAIPLGVTYLGVREPVPELPDEVVLHGEPMLVLQTAGAAPEGQHAWTVLRRGSAQEDVLVTLARRGIDVREQIVTRLDRSPADVIGETAGSPYGLAWAGWRRNAVRATLGHPMPGLYCLGAGMHPGASIPYVAWGAANVAALIGKA